MESGHDEAWPSNKTTHTPLRLERRVLSRPVAPEGSILANRKRGQLSILDSLRPLEDRTMKLSGNTCEEISGMISGSGGAKVSQADRRIRQGFEKDKTLLKRLRKLGDSLNMSRMNGLLPLLGLYVLLVE
jgi:hypothetical protein